MNSWSTHERQRTLRGFTLIELLVVIAIIAILAAILFPVFARVREKAYSNACLSNQRQLALSIIAAAQDHNETLPLPSEWQQQAGISDPKLYDCPSNTKKGSITEPDYGYNEFLFDKGKNFDTDPNDVVAVNTANLDYPAEIELTADITGAVPSRFDAITNPFPKTFTVNGLGNSMAQAITSDFRHQGKITLSFLDGHVEQKKKGSLDCGNSQSIYGIPRSAGKVYLDFTKLTDDAAAKLKWQQAFYLSDPAAGTLLSESFYIPAGKAFNMWQGSVYKLFSQTSGGVTLVTEFDLDPTARWQFRHYDPEASTQGYAAGNVDKDGDGIFEGDLLANLIMIDMPKRELILGTTYGLSVSDRNPTKGSWAKLPTGDGSIIKTLPTGASHFRVYVYSSTNAVNAMRWPVDKSNWWTHNTYTGAGRWYYKQAAHIVVEIDGKTFMNTDYAWPVSYWAMNNTYSMQWRVTYGGMRVRNIMYTAGK